MMISLFGVILAIVGLVLADDQKCVPQEIILHPGTVLATSHDRLFQAGDIFYRQCAGYTARKYIGWCPDPHDTAPKIQIDLPELSEIHGITFQTTRTDCADPNHDYTYDAYLATFSLLYVMAGDMQGNQLTYGQNLSALSSSVGEKYFQLDKPVVTEKLQIIPQSSNIYPCFRFKIHGCATKSMCAAGWCMNGGHCAGKDYCVCRSGFHGDRCQKTAEDVEQQDYTFQRIDGDQLESRDATFNIVGDVTLDSTSSRKRDHHHHHSCHFHSHHGHHCHAQYHHSHGHHSQHNSHGSNHGSSSHCMSHINNHHTGFTTSMNVHFGHNHHGHTYIYSNGGHLHGHSGCSLSYHNQQLHFQVSTGTHQWTASHHCNLQTGSWHNIATSWHPHTGAQLLVNNHVVATTHKPTPTSCTSVCNQTVPLRLGNGHTTTSVNVNINLNFSINSLNMFNVARSVLQNIGLTGPYTNPATTSTTTTTTTPKPTTPTTTPTTTPKPLPSVSATAQGMSPNPTTTSTSTTTPTTTTAKHGPMCYTYSKQSAIGGASSSTKLCQYGEVCALFQDKTGYTAKCLSKPLCEAGKRLATGNCFECCNSYLCNDRCAASTTKQCLDKPTCATMLSTGYDVCKNTQMAVDICKKTCKIC